jgi:ABC-2 type transport system ATP-binding protein
VLARIGFDGGSISAMSTSDSGFALSFRGLSKRYARQDVLKALTFDVAEGELFGLVGVNGAGKTTCIKGMLDFCEISAGSIEIFGRSHLETQARQRVAYLPERFLPPYYLTGRDFLKYMSRLHGVAFDAGRVDDMMQRLDLDIDALGKSVREYSKGMAQKLGLAACFLSDKDLFVLDEPTSGLDPKARILVKRHLQMLRSRGASIFISTHMLTDAEQICDRMGVLHNGQLKFIGTPADACAAYGVDHLEDAYLRLIESDAA